MRLYKLLREDTVGSNFSDVPCKDEEKKLLYLWCTARSIAYIQLKRIGTIGQHDGTSQERKARKCGGLHN